MATYIIEMTGKKRHPSAEGVLAELKAKFPRESFQVYWSSETRGRYWVIGDVPDTEQGLKLRDMVTQFLVEEIDPALRVYAVYDKVST